MQGCILDYNFKISAAYLDRNRLLATIYENIQGLASIFDLNQMLITPKRSVKNHPNIKRWVGYEQTYVNYIAAHLERWGELYGIKEGSINRRNFGFLTNDIRIRPLQYTLLPVWITDELIKNYKKILLEKDYNYYKDKFK